MSKPISSPKFILLKSRLDELASFSNSEQGLFMADDPLQIARQQDDEFAILLCALFAYGGASQIVNFLKKLDFSLFGLNQKQIRKECRDLKYRFQTSEDLTEIFITLSRLKQNMNLKEFFLKAYEKEYKVWHCFRDFIAEIYKINSFRSYGYEFFFGKTFKELPKAPLKRYNLFLRWLVRKDGLDLGLWADEFPSQNLLIPLDVHTHKMALSLGLLQRKSYDFKAVLELSAFLKKFDAKDPIKYDFALYRLGQCGLSFPKINLNS